jgi:hypothetical protein
MRDPTVEAPHAPATRRAPVTWSITASAGFEAFTSSTPLAGGHTMRGARVIIVLAFVIISACFGGKRGSGRVGTNVGDGSDLGGPWTQGSPALTDAHGR